MGVVAAVLIMTAACHHHLHDSHEEHHGQDDNDAAAAAAAAAAAMLTIDVDGAAPVSQGTPHTHARTHARTRSRPTPRPVRCRRRIEPAPCARRGFGPALQDGRSRRARRGRAVVGIASCVGPYAVAGSNPRRLLEIRNSRSYRNAPSAQDHFYSFSSRTRAVVAPGAVPSSHRAEALTGQRRPPADGVPRPAAPRCAARDRACRPALGRRVPWRPALRGVGFLRSGAQEAMRAPSGTHQRSP